MTQPPESTDPVTVRAARVVPPTSAPKDALPDVTPRMHIQLDVENTSDAPVSVWTSRRAYDYEPDDGVLSLRIAEPSDPSPDDIVVVSDHPRVADHDLIAPKQQTTINVSVPTTVRRRIAGTGLGMHYTEQPIGDVNKIDVHLQYADASRHRKSGVRTMNITDEHDDEGGGIVHAVIVPDN